MLTALLGAPAVGATVLRTLAYHQLTAFTNNGAVASEHSLAISADGSKIAFARVDYGSPRSNLIYAVNFDGTGLKLIDAYPGDSPQLDINADGSKVLSWHWVGQPVRLVNADGSNPHQVIYIGGGYTTFRLSPDGTKVFFFVDRDFPTVPDSGPHPAGLYVVNADGTGLQGLAGVNNVANLFGVTANDVYFLYISFYMALSGDGSRLLFQANVTNSLHLLGINADGTGLHELPLAPTPIQYLNNFGLNGDGSKAFYYLTYAPCCSSGEEVGALNWDGGGRRVLLSYPGGGYGVGNHMMQLSRDGSKVLFGDTSYLLNTDGSGRLQLGWSARFAANNVLQWGFYRGVMSGNATQFAYLTPAGANDGGRLQIGNGELNPASLGSAPTITGASANPVYITTNGPSPIFAFSPTPTNSLVPGGGAQAGILLNDIADPATWQGSTLHDDGSSGDAVKGDGIYSDNSGYFYGTPAVGPRTLRFKAELLGGDGKYHATAIDLAPFFVVAQSPTNPPPAIVSITPPTAPPGSQVTITGTGFDPIANNNLILFGNVPAQVISVNPAGTQLVVVVPPELAPGSVLVTVSVQAQTSGGAGFTVINPAAPWLALKVLNGLARLDIYGTIGKTSRIESVNLLLSGSNNWTTLTNVVMQTNPATWTDASSSNQPKRFYRSVQLP